MKRRLTNGDYETNWQTIGEQYIKKFGTIKWDLDNIVAGQYKQSGINLTLRNDDAFWNDQKDIYSFWGGADASTGTNYLSRYRTLVRIQAGYLDSITSETELPTDPTVFLGIINSDFDTSDKNEIKLPVDTLDQVFKEVPGDQLQGSLNGGTIASDYISRIRDWTDGPTTTTGTAVFQKYIAAADWSIPASTIAYPNLNTTTVLGNGSMWTTIQKLAQAENRVAYVTPQGKFLFVSRDAPTTTAVYRFVGIGGSDTLYGHNIKSLDSYRERISRLINRVRVKFDTEETSTSYYTRQENWTWGDGSVSDTFGVHPYKLDNDWIANTTNAVTLGDAIFDEYSEVKYELDLTTKFTPQVFLSDIVEVTYRSPQPRVEPLWGEVLWGQSLWARQAGRGFNVFKEKRFQVIGLSHDVDRFTSKWKLRETT
ncbi:MAG: hypothetical protein V3W19_01910 [Desulfatiglandales bacterium]